MKMKYRIVNNWLVISGTESLRNINTGVEVKLGVFQFKLLCVLIENAGVMCSKDYLLRTVWMDRVVGVNSLSNAIHTLRAVIGDEGLNKSIIKTLAKKGYVLNPEYCQENESVELKPETHRSAEKLSMMTGTEYSEEENIFIPGENKIFRFMQKKRNGGLDGCVTKGIIVKLLIIITSFQLLNGVWFIIWFLTSFMS